MAINFSQILPTIGNDIQSNPVVQNVENTVSNFKPLPAIVGALPGGQAANNFLQSSGLINKVPTVGQIGQNYNQLGQDLTSKNPKTQFNAMMKGGILMGDTTTSDLPPITDQSTNNAQFNPKDYTGNNTWSQWIRDDKTGEVVPNPDYTAGTSSPTQYAQDTTQADKITSEPSQNSVPLSTEEKPPTTTKPNVPEQPPLTPQQQKAFEKSGLDQYQLPASYRDKRTTLEGIDKSVMANVVGGNSPEEIMQKLPVAEQNVWNQVEDKASNITNIDPEKQVMPYIDARLKSLVNQGIINDTQYQDLSTQVGTQLNLKTNFNTGEGLSGQDLIDLQTGANAKAPKGGPNGNNPIPYINDAIASGYRDSIGNVDPNIRYLYNQYSSMKRIGEMSTSFRNTAGAAPTLMDKFKQNPVMGTLAATGALAGTGAVIKDALPLIEGAGSMIAGGVQALPQIGKNAENYIASKAGYTQNTNTDTMNASGNVPVGSNGSSNNPTHNTSIPPVVNIPQSQSQINFDQNGHVGVYNPFNGTDGITKEQYQTQLAQKNATLKAYTTQAGQDVLNPTAEAQDKANIANVQTDIDTLNNLNAKSRGLDQPYQSALALSSMSNQATDDIKKGWSNISLVNGDLNKLATIQNGAYSKLASALKKLQDESGIQIFQPGMNLDVALGNLQQAVQTQLYNSYYSQFPSQGGYDQTGGQTTQSVSNNAVNQVTGNTPLPQITPQQGQNSGTGVAHPFVY